MDRCITENPKILADNKEEIKKKRKSHEMSECCVLMGLGSSNSNEEQLLEAAAFQLILLSNNPPQKSYDCNKGYDSDGRMSGSLGGFRMITGKKKKKKKIQDYGVEGVVKLHENDRDTKSVTSSSSSSSAETVKSGISSVSMEENEVEDNKGASNQRVPQQRRLRSIADIYHATTRL